MLILNVILQILLLSFYNPNHFQGQCKSMSSYSDDDIEGIVFDIGTHRTRIGFSGEDAPKVDTPYWTVPEFRDKYFQEFRLFNPQKFDAETVDEVIEKSFQWAEIGAVSYTHLTLPTIYSV